MFKKFFTYPVFLVIFLSFIGSILFGALLRSHYNGDKRFQSLKKIAVFFAEIPSNLINIDISFNGKNIKFYNHRELPKASSTKNNDKPKFKRFIKDKTEGILILSRYDGNIYKSVIEIINLSDFKTLHQYKIDNQNIINNISDKNKDFVKKKFFTEERFQFINPLVLENGDLVASANYFPLFKVDICSNLKWINDEKLFHHSINLNSNNEILAIARPFDSKFFMDGYIYNSEINKLNNENYSDDLIIKLNQNGKITYTKSISDILVQSNILFESDLYTDSQGGDPIHLNDFEEASYSGLYWEKGDYFLSLKHQNSIIHYRPHNDKIIKYIKGPFYGQHDIDIISSSEISIFNNNNSILEDSTISNVLIYDFKDNSFKKKFYENLKKDNFKTFSEGLSEIFNSGAMLVEEQNFGRIILYNKTGKKEWEYVNKSDSGSVWTVKWSRIIEDEQKIKQLKNSINNKKCTN